MDNELTGTKYIDAHRLRVYKDGSYLNILDLISVPGGHRYHNSGWKWN